MKNAEFVDELYTGDNEEHLLMFDVGCGTTMTPTKKTEVLT